MGALLGAFKSERDAAKICWGHMPWSQIVGRLLRLANTGLKMKAGWPMLPDGSQSSKTAKRGAPSASPLSRSPNNLLHRAIGLVDGGIGIGVRGGIGIGDRQAAKRFARDFAGSLATFQPELVP